MSIMGPVRVETLVDAEASHRWSFDKKGKGAVLSGIGLPTDAREEAPVEIMITHSLVLPDEPRSLDVMETAVQAWALRLAQSALAEAWRVQAA